MGPIIDKLKGEKESAVVEHQAMIEELFKPTVEMVQETEMQDKDEEQKAALKSKISELSNKLLSLEAGLKLKELEVTELRSSTEEKEVMIKSCQEQISEKDKLILEESQTIERMNKSID